MINNKTDIAALSDKECDLLMDELIGLDPYVKARVDMTCNVAKVNKQTALEYVINEYPQLWAKVHLNWTARDYQIPILQYGKDAKRLVLRLGRRLGKCLTEDAEIIDTKTGIRYTIKELKNMSIEERANIFPCSIAPNLDIGENKPFSLAFNGVEDVYKLKTTCGYEVKATANHPFLTIRGWKELHELKEGDYIATIDKLNINTSPCNVPDYDIKFLAYMIGDGSTVDRLYFHNQNEFIANEMKEIVTNYDCTLKSYENRNPNDYVVISNNRRKNKAIDIINKYELRGRYAHNKKVPKEIFSLGEDKIALFLNRLFSTDGCISTVKEGLKRQTLKVTYSSTSEQLAKDIRLLLLRFGIKSYISRNKSLTPDKKRGRDIFTVHIKKLSSIKLFLETIGMVRDLDKQESLLEYCSNNCSEDFIKVPSEILEYVEEVCDKRKINFKELMLTSGMRLYNLRNRPKVIKKSVLVKVANFLEDSYLITLAKSNIYWDKIKVIEHLGKEETYDLTIEENKNFITGDGLITHNTEDMCILMLWFAFRQPNKRTDGTSDAYEILVLTPFETQIDLIFDRLNQLITGSPSMNSMLKRKVQHRFEFDNMSILKGLTVGSRSGNEGSNTRGQAVT